MIDTISNYLRQKLTFSSDDCIIFNNKTLKVIPANFHSISSSNLDITYIDGGQAEIISAGNFCLSFIRVAALTMQKDKKLKIIKKEFFLLTTSTHIQGDIFYESKIFGDRLINENDLFISSNDSCIKSGIERAPINKIATIARRFAELSLATSITGSCLLDGTLEITYPNEEKYLPTKDVAALAKSSSLLTRDGNCPVVLLNQMQSGVWSYRLDGATSFVKLHERSKHVFRFEGCENILGSMMHISADPIFLGYPYGLVLVDKLARVSNDEKHSLAMRFLLNKENKIISDYLQSSNAHEILDNIG